MFYQEDLPKFLCVSRVNSLLTIGDRHWRKLAAMFENVMSHALTLVVLVLCRLAGLVPGISLTRSCCSSVGLAAVVECPPDPRTWRAANLLVTIFLGGTNWSSRTSWSFDGLLLLAGDIEPNPGPQVSSTNRYPCVVCSTEVRNQGICCDSCDRWCHLNCSWLKLNEISLLVSNHNLDVLTLSETWLDASICDAEVSLPGYNLLRQDRNCHGGGVAIFISASIKWTLIIVLRVLPISLQQ